MTCDKFIYLQVLHFLVLLHPIPRRKRTLWSGQGWMLQSWPVLGGNGRHKSSISTSLGKGRCWWWSIAPPHSAHTSLAVLTALLSFFGGKEYHGVLGFIMGKDKFLAFSHGNLHISNLWEKALLSVCLGFLWACTDTNPLCEWKSLVCAWHSQLSPQDDVSENGPRVFYSPAVWARPIFSDKGFCVSQKASFCL